MTARLAGLLGGLVLGVVTGVSVVVLHQSWAWLLVAFAAAAAVTRWLGPGAGRVGFALGWAVVVLRGALSRPEGDYLVPANAAGRTLLAGSLVLVLTVVVTMGSPRPDAEDREVRPTPT